MNWFGKSLKSSTDRQKILRVVLAGLDSNTVPGSVSVRGLISQALKDEGYGDCGVDGKNEATVTMEMLWALQLDRTNLANLDAWAADKDKDALKKGVEAGIVYLQL